MLLCFKDLRKGDLMVQLMVHVVLVSNSIICQHLGLLCEVSFFLREIGFFIVCFRIIGFLLCFACRVNHHDQNCLTLCLDTVCLSYGFFLYRWRHFGVANLFGFYLVIRWNCWLGLCFTDFCLFLIGPIVVSTSSIGSTAFSLNDILVDG